jgi:predicted DsbA family dithiol-disulfide isomerase
MPTTPSESQPGQACDQMAHAYKIQGVPALAVDGKYLVTGKEQGLREICWP